MSKRRIDPTKEHGYIGEVKSKPKSKVITVHPFQTEYIRKRDDCLLADLFVCEDTKLAILEKRK